MINIADLRDPNDTRGHSYRQVNATRVHTFTIGTLVQLANGARAFIVHLGRDCDETSLYWLALNQHDIIPYCMGYHNPNWIGGYAEESLTVV